MKTVKIIPNDHHRARRYGSPRKTDKSGASLQLPSADRLWELLDSNINISVWREYN